MIQAAGMLVAEAEGRLFGLDLQLVHDAVLLGINIFILFLFLSYLLFNPARAMLKKRQDKIAGELETAAEDKRTAAELKADYEEKLKNIHKEEELILSQARKQSKLQEAEIISQAKEEARLIRERAKGDIVLERKKALDEMKQEMISVASMMAGKVVAANIDTTVQAQLLDETLKGIGEDTWQS